MAENSNISDDGMAIIFTLPEVLSEHPQLRMMYDDIIARLRSEANGLPMNTVQLLLLERIAFYYVVMKFSELNGGVSPLVVKDMIKHWQSMTTEFNRQLAAGHEKLRDALLLSVYEVVNKAVSEVADPEIKASLRQRLSGDFAEMGL